MRLRREESGVSEGTLLIMLQPPARIVGYLSLTRPKIDSSSYRTYVARQHGPSCRMEGACPLWVTGRQQVRATDRAVAV